MTTANLTYEPSENGINRIVDECQAISAPLRTECQAARNELAPKGIWQGANLYRSSETVASARAHWIAELTAALDEADRLAILLGESHSGSDELAALLVRIQAVRAELDDLRRSGLGEVRCEIDPDWTNLATWRGDLVEQRKT